MKVLIVKSNHNESEQLSACIIKSLNRCIVHEANACIGSYNAGPLCFTWETNAKLENH